ncbi:hypothetical protein HQ545_01250 [Candidatus Woesearchaeota archaeon]|nr:hypothetical protein [Candidatus Woesearchaeota archaeon]
MVDSNILEEIGKKSQELMRSNQELASKLIKNQELISRFGNELEDIREQTGGKGFGPTARKELENLKSDLEDKKLLVSELIDELKPVEQELMRRDDVINGLNNRIGEQSDKIGALSKEIDKNNELAKQLGISNENFQKQIVEKDSMIDVLKDKLGQLTSTIKKVNKDNSDLTIAQDNAKKDVFGLKNKVGALEKRVFSTDEQNQKLLYELVNQNERVKQLQEALSRKDAEFGVANQNYEHSLETIRHNSVDNKSLMIKSYSRKIAKMNSMVSLLNTRLEQQSRLLDKKSSEELKLIREFQDNMEQLMSRKADFEIGPVAANIKAEFKNPTDKKDDDNNEEIVTKQADNSSVSQSIDKSSYDTPGMTGTSESASVEEIMPIIELAMDHGDSVDKIRHSLHSSGYSKDTVSEAFSRLNIVQ